MVMYSKMVNLRDAIFYGNWESPIEFSLINV